MTFVKDLTKDIPNTTICDWYYYLYLINAAVFVIVLLFTLYSLFFGGKTARLLFGFPLVVRLIIMAISLVSSLFFYLMCDRALLKNE